MVAALRRALTRKRARHAPPARGRLSPEPCPAAATRVCRRNGAPAARPSLPAAMPPGAALHAASRRAPASDGGRCGSRSTGRTRPATAPGSPPAWPTSQPTSATSSMAAPHRAAPRASRCGSAPVWCQLEHGGAATTPWPWRAGRAVQGAAAHASACPRGQSLRRGAVPGPPAAANAGLQAASRPGAPQEPSCSPALRLAPWQARGTLHSCSGRRQAPSGSPAGPAPAACCQAQPAPHAAPGRGGAAERPRPAEPAWPADPWGIGAAGSGGGPAHDSSSIGSESRGCTCSGSEAAAGSSGEASLDPPQGARGVRKCQGGARSGRPLGESGAEGGRRLAAARAAWQDLEAAGDSLTAAVAAAAAAAAAQRSAWGGPCFRPCHAHAVSAATGQAPGRPQLASGSAPHAAHAGPAAVPPGHRCGPRCCVSYSPHGSRMWMQNPLLHVSSVDIVAGAHGCDRLRLLSLACKGTSPGRRLPEAGACALGALQRISQRTVPTEMPSASCRR